MARRFLPVKHGDQPMADRRLPAETADAAIPVLREEAQVETRLVERGRVQVRTGVETHVETVEQALSGETVSVERVPVGREVDSVPAVREDNGVTIIPVVEERLVVEKRLWLVEELHVHREVTREVFREEVPLRRTTVDVRRLPAEE
jgi:stress response protein YsnF